MMQYMENGPCTKIENFNQERRKHNIHKPKLDKRRYSCNINGSLKFCEDAKSEIKKDSQNHARFTLITNPIIGQNQEKKPNIRSPSCNVRSQPFTVKTSGRNTFSYKLPLESLSQKYTYSELCEATDSFNPDRRLGEGASSTVYMGVLSSGTDVAVKVFKKNVVNKYVEFEDEIRVLSRCRHPNLVTLYGWAKHKDNLYLVYEFLPGGDVSRRLEAAASSSRVDFNWEKRLRVAIETCQATSYLHGSRPKVFHRDIKTANILLNEHGVAKLADLGLACVATENSVQSCRVRRPEGTPGYADPEYVRTLEINEAREVYSLGMLLLELFTNKAPAFYISDSSGGNRLKYLIDEIDSPECISQLMDPLAGFPETVAQDWIHISLRCIVSDESSRPTSAQILHKLKEIASQHCTREKYAYQINHRFHHRSLITKSKDTPDSAGSQILPGSTTSSDSRKTNPYAPENSNSDEKKSTEHDKKIPDSQRDENNPNNIEYYQETHRTISLQSVSPESARHRRAYKCNSSYDKEQDIAQLPGGWNNSGITNTNTSNCSYINHLNDLKYFQMESFMNYASIFESIDKSICTDHDTSHVIPGITLSEMTESLHDLIPHLANNIYSRLTDNQQNKFKIDTSFSEPLTHTGLAIVFGRKRIDFRQNLKKIIPPNLFSCISRYHFSITPLIKISPCYEETTLAKILSASYIYNCFTIQFLLSSLSPNGSGPGSQSLDVENSTILRSGDVFNLFHSAASDIAESPHRTPIKLPMIPLRFMVNNQWILALKQKIVAVCLKHIKPQINDPQEKYNVRYSHRPCIGSSKY